MKSIIDSIKETKKLSEGIINISFHYVIFLITLFLVWQPNYVKLIAASSWVPENIEMFLLGIVNLIYQNIIPIYLTLAIILVILLLITKLTNIFDKILPEDMSYSNHMKISWNQYSAMNKIIRLIINLATVFWIYYFLINVFFNPNNYVENLFRNDSKLAENELITTGYMTNIDLELMTLFLWLNIIITVYLVVRSLFEIKVPISNNIIKTENIKFYIELNSFQQKNRNDEENEIIILKDKYHNKPYFYLVNVQLTRQEPVEVNDTIKKVNRVLPYHKRIYKVINYSRDLNEIIYHFNYLTNNTSKVIE